LNSAIVVCDPISEAISSGNIIWANNFTCLLSQELIGRYPEAGMIAMVVLAAGIFGIHMLFYRTGVSFGLGVIRALLGEDRKGLTQKLVLKDSGEKHARQIRRDRNIPG
jgi:hypothetical protein